MSSEETNKVMANEAREDAEQGGTPVVPVSGERVPDVDGEEDLPGVVYPAFDSSLVLEPDPTPGKGGDPEAPEEAADEPKEGGGGPDEVAALREELERVADELGGAQAEAEESRELLAEARAKAEALRERNVALSDENNRINGLALMAERYEQKGSRRFLDSLDQLEAIRAQAMQALSMQPGAEDAPQGG